MSGLLAALIVTPVMADELADVTKLVRSGQYAEALTKTDAFLAKNPRDPQMRFLKGVILTEQNKSAEAIAIFTKLTEDFPTLPEPYNNLAVLYASSGQYEKARVALDAAIRTNPTYATAYENLGDVHAKLASQAYDKALQLDSTNAGAKSKLTLVRSLVSTMNGNVNPKATTPASPPVATVPKVPEPVATAPVSGPKVAAVTPPPAPGKPASVASAPDVVAKSTANNKQEQAKAEAKPEPKKSSSNEQHPETDDVLNVVNAWAKSWSSQDVKAYLGYYGPDFQEPNGLTRKAWEEERRSRIEGKGRISVKVESPQVNVNGNTATVKFRQVYVSDRLKANARKTLVLTKNGSKWQIKQENAGS